MGLITLARVLGRETSKVSLLPFAWGGWMLIADLGDRIDGYPIVTDHTCDGLLIAEHRDLPDLDEEGVAAMVLGAIQRGVVLRWSEWRDVSDRVRRA